MASHHAYGRHGGHHPPQQQSTAAHNKVMEIAYYISGRGSLTEQIHAINLLNKHTAEPDHELLASRVLEVLDAVADGLDAHNLMAKELDDRVARSRELAKQAKLGEKGMQDFAFTPMASSISQQLFPRGRVENVPEYYDHMAAGLLSIVRNLSLIVANEETLAYHPRLLHHIVSLLPCWKTELGIFSLEILTLVSKFLDVGGILPAQPEDEIGLIDDGLMALAPPRVKAQCLVDDAMSKKYTNAVLHLLPQVIDLLLADVEDRTCLVRSLELYCRLMGFAANAHLLARHTPPPLLERFHELLYVPFQGMDSLARPEEPPVPQHPLRYNFQSWDYAVDVEVRDLAVEALALLSAFHDKVLEMAALPGLVRSLVALVTTKANGRPETPRMAGRMLGIMAAADPGVRSELEVLREPIIHEAFHHPVMAEVLWAIHLYLPPEETTAPLVVEEAIAAPNSTN